MIRSIVIPRLVSRARILLSSRIGFQKIMSNNSNNSGNSLPITGTGGGISLFSTVNFYEQLVAKAKSDPKSLSEEDWKEILDPRKYEILREHGTEPPWSYKEDDEPDGSGSGSGLYLCGACSNPLFNKDDKFESGSGWPSFTKPIQDSNVDLKVDKSLGMKRTEVLCQKCGSHLGHVFPDGPKEATGLRFCINGLALEKK